MIVYVGKLGMWYLDAEMARFFAVAHAQDPRLRLRCSRPAPRGRAAPGARRVGVPEDAFAVRRVAPDQVPAELEAADAGLSLIKQSFSKRSSSPTKVGEYLAAGLPVVSTAGIGDCDRMLADEAGRPPLQSLDDELRARAQALGALLDDARHAPPLPLVRGGGASLEATGAPRYAALYGRLLGPAGGAMRRLDPLALVPYPLGTTPSQRFRLEQWAPLLASEHGIRVHWSPFADARLAALLTRPGHLAGKAARWPSQSVARLQGPAARATSRRRAGAPRGVPGRAPPGWSACWRGWAAVRSSTSTTRSRLQPHVGRERVLRPAEVPGKTATLCRIASLVVAGCGYLADYARRHNERTVVVPTSIDTDAYARCARTGRTGGWSWAGPAARPRSRTWRRSRRSCGRCSRSGRSSCACSTRSRTCPACRPCSDAGRRRTRSRRSARSTSGSSPCPTTPGSRQVPDEGAAVLALGVPAVCSDVGTAGEAVRPGENGFLATTPDEWTGSPGAPGGRSRAAHAHGRGRAPHGGRALLGRGQRLARSRRRCARSWSGHERAGSGRAALAGGGGLHARLRPAGPRSLCVLLRLQPPPPDLLLESLLPAPAAPTRLLDVGCGTGHHLLRLLARGYRGAGVDGSAAMLAQARSLGTGIALLAQADVARLPIASATQDVVLCVEVLRYLPDTAPLLHEIARVLRPGGTCLVTAVPRLSLNGYPLVNRLLPRGRGFLAAAPALHERRRAAARPRSRRACRTKRCTRSTGAR